MCVYLFDLKRRSSWRANSDSYGSYRARKDYRAKRKKWWMVTFYIQKGQIHLWIFFHKNTSQAIIQQRNSEAEVETLITHTLLDRGHLRCIFFKFSCLVECERKIAHQITFQSASSYRMILLSRQVMFSLDHSNEFKPKQYNSFFSFFLSTENLLVFLWSCSI